MIVVTGASGLIGTHLTRELSRNYAHESILALYHSHKPNTHYPNVKYRSCNLKDWEDVLQTIPKNAEVYHCAAIVSFDKKSHKTLVEDNVKMTENIVNACLINGIKKIVHVSSIAALSREKTHFDESAPIDESAQWTNSNSNTLYSKSKYFSELEVWRGIEEGLNAVIVNPGIILGENNDWTKGSSALFHNVAKGLKYYTDGVNGYVDVVDVVKAMQIVMKSNVNRERFLLVEGNYSYQELFSKIASQLSIKGPTISAKPWMSKLVVLKETIKSFITQKPQLITSETARTAFQKNFYSNKKFIRFFPEFSYTDIDMTISRIVNSYKNVKI